MKVKTVAWKYLAFILVLVSPKLFGQTAPEGDIMDEDIFEMSPFVVEGTEDEGYRADATLAGTRIRTELKDVGSAISVVTEQFITDTGSTDSQELLVYATNTEVGGQQGTFNGAGNGALIDNSDQRIAPNNTTRVRGLTNADNTRDFFLTDIPWDSFNVGRIDLQRGPNAILFGLGSPAGIINASVENSAYEDSTELELRFGSYGTGRASIDINRVILEDELSIRIEGLAEDQKFQQEPAYERDNRIYVTAEYKPSFLQTENTSLTIRAKYETGDIDANRPRQSPPMDAITPWFTELNRQGYSPLTSGLADTTRVAELIAAGDLGAGARDASSGNVNNWIANASRIYDNAVAVFPEGDSSFQTVGFMSSNGHATRNGVNGTISGMDWWTWNGIRTYDLYASQEALPYYELGAYKAKHLTDPTIFNFYDILIDGPNKNEWQRWNAFNVSISETFFGNKLGIEYVYDTQDYDQGAIEFLDGFAEQLTIDINTVLMDGSPNPNFGRPYVASDSANNISRSTQRDNHRITAFGEIDFRDFMDESSWITRLLGRHVLTGLWARSENRTDTRKWIRHCTDDLFGEFVGTMTVNSPNRQLATISYLGESLANRTTASGANIPGITAVQQPGDMQLRYFDFTFDPYVDPAAEWINPNNGSVSTQSENPSNYGGWATKSVGIWNSDNPLDKEQLVREAQKIKERIDSKALIWQSYLWDDLLVGTIGWRKDRARSYDAGAEPMRANETVDFDQEWEIPDEPNNDVEGETTSYSVVLHSPEFVKNMLPGDTEISLFYNKSSNFQPAAGRVDILGDPLPAPSGETKDYGFVIRAFNNKLSFKVNWYETNVTDAALDNFGGAYMIGAAEAWGYMFARQAVEGFGNFSQPYVPGPDQTQEEAIAEQELATSTYLANVDSHFMEVYNIDINQWNSWMNWSDPSGLTITGDTASKGTEYELIYQPVSNWNISINASKTSAQRVNMAGSLTRWVEERWAFYQGPAGLVRMWGNWYSPGETIRGKFGREFMSPYNLYRRQENADVPELRPWRFNLVTNYAFEEGMLKGFNIGASYRWADEIILGYPITEIDGEANFDLENPYYGSAENNLDLWAGYERMLTDKIHWRIQLNVRNAFQENDLIPISVQPDGSAGAFRIQNEATWSITNTFSF